MTRRPRLAEIGLNTGKKARLHRILHTYGLGTGTAPFLLYDQGLEHASELGADLVKVNFPRPDKRADVPGGYDAGLIFGRNVWQRDHDESLRLVARLKEILAKYPSD